MSLNTQQLNRFHERFFWWNEDEPDKEIINEIVNNEHKLYEYWIDPFIAELENNFLQITNNEERSNLVCFYLTKLQDHATLPSYFKEVLFNGDLVNRILKNDTDFEKAIKLTYEILEAFFLDIQKLCLVYNLDILKICKRAYYPIEHYDQSYAYMNKDLNEDENSNLPEFEINKPVEKIAWLHELGVLQIILNQCKIEESYNWRKAAHIIFSFTDINPETIRKSLTAIFNENENNKKNNPLNNPKNLLFIAEMRRNFKLDKEKED